MFQVLRGIRETWRAVKAKLRASRRQCRGHGLTHWQTEMLIAQDENILAILIYFEKQT